MGQTVQCPECRHQFTAALESVSPQPPVTPTPSQPKPRYDDDLYDDDRRPRRDRYDDDDHFDIARRDRIRNEFAPHRGGLILALGLVSLVGGMTFCLPAVAGPFAWAMGSYDLREIREGRMDPSGEGMTRAGQICGIIGTVLLMLVVVYFFCVFGMLAGGF